MIDSLSVKVQVMVSRAMLQKKQLPTIGLFLVGASERASHHYLEKYRDSTQTAEADSVPKLTKEQPLFSTQTDSLGRFHLAGLKAGHYRVVAFVDVNGNQKIETSAELAGVATADLILTPEYSGALWVPLADQDTTPVSLESVTQVSKNALTAKFSKNLLIDSTLLDKENCVLLTADSTRIRPTWIFRAPRSNDMQYVFDSLANADSSYTFRCAYGKDSVGRFLDSRLASLSIDWTEQKGDTLPSKMVATAPSMNAKNVFTKDSIWITYDKPLADSVLDSLRRVLILVQNQDTLPVNVFRKDPVRFAVYGNEAFLTDAKVELLERYADSTLSSPDSVTGNRDTIVTIKTRPWVKFEAVPKLQLASLSGKIPGGSTDTRVRIRKADSDQFTTVSCTANGSFQMDDLTEGKYLMEYFRTKDSLNVPYAGKLFHFEHGMPWRALVDTLVIERGANVLNADIEGL
jgi:hypothetical protein